MKKRKLLSILSIVLSCSIILPSCKLHKIQPTTEAEEDDEEDDEEEKVSEPAVTAADMFISSIDQFISDGRMFAEEDATTASTTTSAPTEPEETLLAPEATMVSTYTIGDMSYSVTNDWMFNDDSENGIHDFFVDVAVRRSVMMVYMSEDDSEIIANANAFEEYVKAFEASFVSVLENGTVISSETHTDGKIYYADIVFDGVYANYNNIDMNVYFRLYAVPNTNKLYAFSLLADKNDADIMDSIMTTYQDVIESVEFTGVDLYTEYTLDRVTYSVPSDWQYIRQDGTDAFVPDILTGDTILMVFRSETSYVNGMTNEQFADMVHTLNDAILGGMVNGTLQQNDIYGDAELQYADVIYDGIYNEKDSVLYARYYADPYGVGYFFIFQIDKPVDEESKEEALAQYKKIISNVVFDVSQ